MTHNRTALALLGPRPGDAFSPEDYLSGMSPSAPTAILLHANRAFYNQFQSLAIALLVWGAAKGEYTNATARWDRRDAMQFLAHLIGKHIEALEAAGWEPNRDPRSNPVDLPAHYDSPVEPTLFGQLFGLDVLTFQAHKYLHRYPAKNGIEDLRKAQRNVHMWLSYSSGDRRWSLPLREASQ